jgi:hypothetical protein
LECRVIICFVIAEVENDCTVSLGLSHPPAAPETVVVVAGATTGGGSGSFKRRAPSSLGLCACSTCLMNSLFSFQSSEGEEE